MKLPFFVKDFENEQAPFSRESRRKSLENKWIALSQKSKKILNSARTYKALYNKLTKDQKSQVVVLKVPIFDQNIP